MNPLSQLKRLMNHSLLFEPLSAGAKAHLLPLFEIIAIDEQTVLFSDEQKAEYVYFLLEGKGALQLHDTEIKLRPTMCFGEESLLDQHYYFGEAQIFTGTVARIKKYRLIELLKQDRKILNAMVLGFSRSFNQKLQRKGKKAPKRYSHHQTRNEKVALVGWVCVLIAPLLAYYGCHLTHFSAKQSIFLSILSGTVVLWGFRLVPEFVAAFFSLLVYLGIGLTDPIVVLSGFSSKTFIMALSIFGLSAIVLSSPLLYRFLLMFLKVIPSKTRWIMMSLLSLGGLLTPVIPDTSSRLRLATTFLRDTYAVIHLGFKGRIWTLGVSNALQSAILFGPMFLSSSVRHYILLGLFWGQYQEQFQWIGWLHASWITIIILGITNALIFGILSRKEKNPQISKPLIKTQLEILGPLSPSEWGILTGILLCFLGMTTAQYHHIQPEIISLLILSTLLSFGFIHQKGFNTTINWTELIYLAGLSGLLSTAQSLGLFEVFATTLQDFGKLISINFEWFILTLFMMISMTRFFMPKGAVALLYAFFFIPLSQSVGISPWVPAFLILIFSETFYFPFQSPEYLDMRQFLFKFTPYDERHVLMINCVMNIMKLGAVYASLPYWRYLGMIP